MTRAEAFGRITQLFENCPDTAEYLTLTKQEDEVYNIAYNKAMTELGRKPIFQEIVEKYSFDKDKYSKDINKLAKKIVKWIKKNYEKVKNWKWRIYTAEQKNKNPNSLAVVLESVYKLF